VKNGEWGMKNGEWGMKNGEWGMKNGEWGMKNGEWGMVQEAKRLNCVVCSLYFWGHNGIEFYPAS